MNINNIIRSLQVCSWLVLGGATVVVALLVFGAVRTVNSLTPPTTPKVVDVTSAEMAERVQEEHDRDQAALARARQTAYSSLFLTAVSVEAAGLVGFALFQWLAGTLYLMNRFVINYQPRAQTIPSPTTQTNQTSGPMAPIAPTITPRRL
jgi:hypothetical protein